ncbi:MAG: efflux RND transporter periplasmic adaptor subunit [Candidatus Aminicenantes bacterium]|nr:MAG: efflux RND transporter periplasmic adaptor subunit [Candidatus Aminicenantes bacterium]
MIKKYSFIIIIIILIFLCFCGKHGNNNQQVQEKQENKGLQARQVGAGNQHQHRTRNQYRYGRNSRLSGTTVITLSEEEKSQTQIKTITVKENPIQSTLKAMGKVLAPPDGKAIVGYTFPGRIIKLDTAIGQWVKKGDPLVTLECEDVGNTKSEYFKAFTEFRLAKQNFEREERLYKKDIGAKKDYLETKAQLEIANSSLEAAEKKLQVMGFSQQQIQELTKAKNISPHVTVNAPIAGRVIQNNAVLGAMIEPSSEIMTILDPTTLCIDAEIYEKDLAKIKTNQKVQIAVPAYPEETFAGRIYYIGDIVHPETRTITVRTRVPNKDFKLKPGMFADIKILLDQRENAVTVPIEAVLDDLDRKIVFVQEEDNYICRIVEVGPKFNGLVEIVKGLKRGETVVVEGNYQLKSRLREEILKRAHVH